MCAYIIRTEPLKLRDKSTDLLLLFHGSIACNSPQIADDHIKAVPDPSHGYCINFNLTLNGHPAPILEHRMCRLFAAATGLQIRGRSVIGPPLRDLSSQIACDPVYYSAIDFYFEYYFENARSVTGPSVRDLAQTAVASFTRSVVLKHCYFPFQNKVPHTEVMKHAPVLARALDIRVEQVYNMVNVQSCPNVFFKGVPQVHDINC